MLRLDACSAGWKGHPVFRSLSLDCRPGEILAIVGPSGCGKTTLLKLCAGLNQPSEGSVLLGSQVPGSKKSPDIAYIMQEYGLFPWFSVLGNVELGLKIRRMAKAERQQKCRQVLGEVGLAGLERRYPAELSGGQRQRVALARSLVLKPALLLMDEPFSALDALTREKLQDQFRALLDNSGIISILVTHSVEEAVYLGTRLMYMTPAPDSRLIEIPALQGTRGPAVRQSEAYFHACAALRGVMEAQQ